MKGVVSPSPLETEEMGQAACATETRKDGGSSGIQLSWPLLGDAGGEVLGTCRTDIPVTRAEDIVPTHRHTLWLSELPSYPTYGVSFPELVKTLRV